MRPFVSVVIPAYNEQRYLPRCIESLLKQTYKPLEVIFVDDGSTDATKRILSDAAKKHKMIKAFFRPHSGGGPGLARNFGAKKARGSILVFVDADMVFDPRYVEMLTKPVRDGKTHGTFHTKELVANKENPWARAWCLNRIPEGIKESGVYRAVQKDRFLAAGGFNPKLGYFDDNLGSLGSASPVPAVCYHNNPETLGEVFKHSMWVGKSLLKNPHSGRKAKLAIALSLVGIAAILALAILSSIWWLVAAAGLAVLAWLVISLRRTIPRLKEGYPEYLITIPTLWLFRLAGYYIGAIRQLFKG